MKWLKIWIKKLKKIFYLINRNKIIPIKKINYNSSVRSARRELTFYNSRAFVRRSSLFTIE